MKQWRFFPILVKEEVLKSMDLSDKLSFAKCSKKSRNLLSCTPNHLRLVRIIDDASYEDLLTMLTSQKSNVQTFKVKIDNDSKKDQVDEFFENLRKLRNSLKVKEVDMDIDPKYSEMNKKIIDFCDPSFIESMKIHKLDSQEVYEDILRTPQWKNSQKVTLNWYFDEFFEGKEALKVNINDFLHFKFIKLRMEELSVDDAWKLVQNIVSTRSQDGHIDIRIQANAIKGDLISQKIETELVGDWKDVGPLGGRYLRHPENPNQVLEYSDSWDMFFVGIPNPEEFNTRLFPQFQ